jgi:hypothetical protein
VEHSVVVHDVIVEGEGGDAEERAQVRVQRTVA